MVRGQKPPVLTVLESPARNRATLTFPAMPRWLGNERRGEELAEIVAGLPTQLALVVKPSTRVIAAETIMRPNTEIPHHATIWSGTKLRLMQSPY